MDRAKAISPLSIRTKLCATNEDRAGAGCLRPNFAPCLEVPSDESPTAITNIGVAAHICAASSEGRRYPAHDTWLHVTRRAPPHLQRDLAVFRSRRVDRSGLRDLHHRMLTRHEAEARNGMRGNSAARLPRLRRRTDDLIAFGPGISLYRRAAQR